MRWIKALSILSGTMAPMPPRRRHPPTDDRRIAILVDDDTALLDALRFSFEAADLDVLAFDCAESLLVAELPRRNACLVLDYRLPGRTGLEALQTLQARGSGLPAIFITSHPQLELRRAMARTGALIVEKPLLQDALLATLCLAIDAANLAAPLPERGVWRR